MVAFANIQIPSLLGDIINVLSRYTSSGNSETRSYFLNEIWIPSVKLFKVYITQVSSYDIKIGIE